MQAEEAKMLLEYLADSKNKLLELEKQRDELEDKYYNCLHGISMSDSPGGGGPGDVTASLACKAADWGAREQMQEIALQAEVLRGDAALIRREVNGLHSVYSAVLRDRHILGYSWKRIARETKLSERQLYRMEKEAVKRLAEALDAVPMVEELLIRARRARK